MNISVRTLIVIIVATLAAGLILGNFIFGDRNAQDHQHTEVIDGETVWTCSMHPQVRQQEAGKCPICGMDLVSMTEDEGHSIDPQAIAMSPTAMQLASVVTAVVGSNEEVKPIRLTGKIQEDERMVFSQTTHVPGRIERLAINFTGEFVEKGAIIAYLYSPELVTAQQELFETHKIRESQPNLYQAARNKLKNWKLSDRQIDRILSSGKTIDEFPIRSDQSGYVINKLANLGDHVQIGQALYEIANLSQVWVLFDLYEADLSWVSVGDSIQFTINSIPGKVYKHRIDYIDPIIDPKTRVAKARVVLKNTQQQLKPEMFVSGTLEASMEQSGEQLSVPKSAVLWTGKRSVVYVKLQTDAGIYFRLREVTLGAALDDAYLVEDGLVPGEEIAVNGTFSIDAAAQLAGKPSMMNPKGKVSSGDQQMGNGQSSGTSVSPASTLSVNEANQTYEADDQFRQQLKAVFAAYLPLKDALVTSEGADASDKAEQLMEVIQEVDGSLVKQEALQAWTNDLKTLTISTQTIANSQSLEQAREMFQPLSDQLYHSLKKFQVEVRGYRQYCPMAFDFKGAYWLSDSEQVINPYFGDEMLNCGNVEERL